MIIYNSRPRVLFDSQDASNFKVPFEYIDPETGITITFRTEQYLDSDSEGSGEEEQYESDGEKERSATEDDQSDYEEP